MVKVELIPRKTAEQHEADVLAKRNAPPQAAEIFPDMSFRSEVRPELPPQQQISWAPIGVAKLIPFSGSSYQTVRSALVKTFGPFPIRLDREHHLQYIFAMKNAAGDGGAAYEAIFSALSTLPGIELTEF